MKNSRSLFNMAGENNLWLWILGFFGIVVLVFMVWVYRLKPSTPVNCKTMSPDQLWDDSCLFLKELQKDSTLASPKGLKLKLVSFLESDGVGPVTALPMWYRFRYVNSKTGGYSDFSEWTDSPVQSGSETLPCLGGDGGCSPTGVPSGKKSCTMNRPILGISPNELQYNIIKNPDIYTNVHRYTASTVTDHNPPGIDAIDEIVGFLLPPTFYAGSQYNTIQDVLFNPCKAGCNTPPGC